MAMTMIYGHHCSFFCKMHGMVVLQMPLTLALPLFAHYLGDSDTRFHVYILNMIVLGVINSIQTAGLFGQGAKYPRGEQLAAIALGIGLSAIILNVTRFAMIGIGELIDMDRFH